MVLRVRCSLSMVLSLIFLSQSWANDFSSMNVPSKTGLPPAPEQVKISVSRANWVETISICNISSMPIPLTNIEFVFNYNIPMPANIWGNSAVNWNVVSQSGTVVVLKGSTSSAAPLNPDPECTNPLTVQFEASPDAIPPLPPFLFRSEAG